MRFRCPFCDAAFDARGRQFEEVVCPACSRRFREALTIPEGELKPLSVITQGRPDEDRNLNEEAAAWWAERFEIEALREQLKAALIKHLPQSDWLTYNDYDPNDLLLAAVREVTVCTGSGNSGVGLFPCKTGLKREGARLWAKEGREASWEEVG